MLGKHWFSEACAGYATSWQLRAKVYDARSAHQKVVVYETETFGFLMTLDDVVMLSTRDHFIYHEMMTHPALFVHPEPRQAVIVGGGDCGSLCEVLKHSIVRQVVQVELDAVVTRTAERFFPQLCANNDDPRAEILFQDAVQWMSVAASDSQDVLILDTTDPVGQAARLFSRPFYADCHRVLRPGGILVAQSESPLLDISILQSMRTVLAAAGFHTLQTIFFPVPSYPSGWWSATMARKDQAFPDCFRPVRKSPLDTRYYNADIHGSCTAMPEFLRASLLC